MVEKISATVDESNEDIREDISWSVSELTFAKSNKAGTKGPKRVEFEKGRSIDTLKLRLIGKEGWRWSEMGKKNSWDLDREEDENERDDKGIV